MIGVDLVSIPRIERLLKRFGKNALMRFLHPSEIDLAQNPATTAGFWAAKEAFSKAIGTGIGKECSFFDILIYKDSLGSPHIKVSKNLAKKFEIKDISLSITHDANLAIAVVAIEHKEKKKEITFN